MGSVALDQLRTKVLALSEAERAELAHDLVVSLDGEPEGDVANEWDAEVLQRLDQIDAGAATFVSREEFKRLLRHHLKPS